MNYFVALVLGGTLVSVAVGALLGLFRGMRRSILRAALLVLCFVLALALCGSVSNAIVNIKISDGKTIEELLASSFSEGGKAVTDIVIPMAQAFAKVIAFVVIFGLLQFVTWILVFPILKLVLRPLIGRRAHARLLGLVLGAACGLFVAFAVYAPINGLLIEAGKLASIDLSSVTSDSASGTQVDDMMMVKDSGITEYSSSGISKFYSGIGGGFYRSLSTVENKDGEKVTISSQIDALSAAAKLATKAAALKNVTNPDGTINVDSVRELAKALTEMDELTPEAKKALNGMLKSATESLGDDVPEAIKNLDVENIDFKSEGELLLTAADVMEKDGNLDDVDMTKLVNDCSKSTVILDTLVDSDVTIPVDGEKRAEVDAAIADLESKTGNEAVDDATIAKLKALFGDGANSGEN